MSRKNRSNFAQTATTRDAERDRRRRRLAAKGKHPRYGISKSAERKAMYAR